MPTDQCFCQGIADDEKARLLEESRLLRKEQERKWRQAAEERWRKEWEAERKQEEEERAEKEKASIDPKEVEKRQQKEAMLANIAQVRLATARTCARSPAAALPLPQINYPCH